MSEWKKYTGSDEQIAEILQHANGLLTEDNVIVDCDKNLLLHDILAIGDKYILCNPHPLADMICHQARTGQPVWVRYTDEQLNATYTSVTNTPDWNLPGAEYSFAPLEVEPFHKPANEGDIKIYESIANNYFDAINKDKPPYEGGSMSESSIDMERCLQGVGDEAALAPEITWTNCDEQMPPDDVILNDIGGCILIHKKSELTMYERILLNNFAFHWTPYTPEKWEELNK